MVALEARWVHCRSTPCPMGPDVLLSGEGSRNGAEDWLRPIPDERSPARWIWLFASSFGSSPHWLCRLESNREVQCESGRITAPRCTRLEIVWDRGRATVGRTLMIRSGARERALFTGFTRPGGGANSHVQRVKPHWRLMHRQLIGEGPSLSDGVQRSEKGDCSRAMPPLNPYRILVSWKATELLVDVARALTG